MIIGRLGSPLSSTRGAPQDHKPQPSYLLVDRQSKPPGGPALFFCASGTAQTIAACPCLPRGGPTPKATCACAAILLAAGSPSSFAKENVTDGEPVAKRIDALVDVAFGKCSPRGRQGHGMVVEAPLPAGCREPELYPREQRESLSSLLNPTKIRSEM